MVLTQPYAYVGTYPYGQAGDGCSVSVELHVPYAHSCVRTPLNDDLCICWYRCIILCCSNGQLLRMNI